MTPRLLCPIGLYGNNALPVTDILEYDVKAGTHYALVVAGSDAPRWRTCDELIITLGGAA
jgi:hypothetical protein